MTDANGTSTDMVVMRAESFRFAMILGSVGVGILVVAILLKFMKILCWMCGRTDTGAKLIVRPELSQKSTTQTI